jgi:hypothetical protein
MGSTSHLDVVDADNFATLDAKMRGCMLGVVQPKPGSAYFLKANPHP